MDLWTYGPMDLWTYGPLELEPSDDRNQNRHRVQVQAVLPDQRVDEVVDQADDLAAGAN